MALSVGSLVIRKLTVAFSADVAGTAMGILLVWYQVSKPDCTIWGDDTINVGTSYSISVSLNVLLTLMIVVRLILFKRDVRNAMSTPVKVGGLYNTVITMLVESSALYAVSFLLFIATWAAKNSVTYVFFPILAQAQVRAVFCIFLVCRSVGMFTNFVDE